MDLGIIDTADVNFENLGLATVGLVDPAEVGLVSLTTLNLFWWITSGGSGHHRSALVPYKSYRSDT